MAEADRLREEIIRLGPWHFDVEVAEGLTTRASLEAPPGTYPEQIGKIPLQDNRDQWRMRMKKLYPDGLEGRSFLDCACNGGAYLFWSRELGAGRCFGFDVREHWIRQARFLKEHRQDTDDIDFEVMNLYDLPARGLEPFDITGFAGIFYHLPDPVTGLKIAADLTKELLLFDTATRAGLPDGALAVLREDTEKVMLGADSLAWRPTGPETVEQILRWAGFVDVHVIRWVKEIQPGWGRLAMAASKREGLLDSLRAR
jgi:SAM-dependent methyltransferase